jgi:hypothetical protein
LELIGALNDHENFACRDLSLGTTISSGIRGGSFYLLFYKQPNYHKDQNFKFFIEVIYEDISQKDL